MPYSVSALRSALPCCVLALSCLLAVPALAGSVLELPYPAAFGGYDAAAYDERGQIVGDGKLQIVELEDGRVQLTVVTKVESGESMTATALLAPIAGKRALRVIEQRTESIDAQGHSRGVLRVDHENAVATCAQEGEKTKELALPSRDSIVNVPLNLLFQPLATDPAREVDFQILLCSGGPRVIDFSTTPATRISADVIEVRYQPDLGGLLNFVADSMIPKLSFWIDEQGGYVAHRSPLYSKGPEVLLIREGLGPAALTVRRAAR